MSTTSARVAFVDLARAAAVLFMIQGHTLAVLLGPEYQGSGLFNFWLYLRGLTSCGFLVLSGFSFSLATDRYWADYQAASPRLRRRLTRFGIFLLLGYSMRIPIRPLTDFSRVTPEQWQTFAIVDILQLVAVTLTALQVLAWLAGTRRRFALFASVAAGTIVLLAPVAWRVDWSPVLPVFLVSYLTDRTGSLFPLFPWGAYLFLGAALGMWFVTGRDRRSPGEVSRAFLFGGTAMIGVAWLLHQVPLAPYGAIEFWRISPNLFLAKAGSVLVALAGAVLATRWRPAMPRIVTVLSRESLLIYFIHVCVLYGSIWNDGLIQAIGPHLGVLATAAWVLVLLSSMSILALLWHDCKQRSWHLSTLIRAAVALAAVYAIS